MIILFSIILGTLLFILYNCKESKEHFSPGTQVQMLTSTPYYNWYDYFSRFRSYFYPTYHPTYYSTHHPTYYPGRYPRSYYGYSMPHQVPYYRPTLY